VLPSVGNKNPQILLLQEVVLSQYFLSSLCMFLILKGYDECCSESVCITTLLPINLPMVAHGRHYQIHTVLGLVWLM